MKRYWLSVYGDQIEEVDTDEGEWVKYTEAADRIAQLERGLAEAQVVNGRLQRSVEFWTSDHEKRWVGERARADALLEGMKKLRAEWLEDNTPSDGSDVVTPFDQYLHGQEVAP